MKRIPNNVVHIFSTPAENVPPFISLSLNYLSQTTADHHQILSIHSTIELLIVDYSPLIPLDRHTYRINFVIRNV